LCWRRGAQPGRCFPPPGGGGGKGGGHATRSRGHGERFMCTRSPPPQTLPRKRGREQTEFGASCGCSRGRRGTSVLRRRCSFSSRPCDGVIPASMAALF